MECEHECDDCRPISHLDEAAARLVGAISLAPSGALDFAEQMSLVAQTLTAIATPENASLLLPLADIWDALASVAEQVASIQRAARNEGEEI